MGGRGGGGGSGVVATFFGARVLDFPGLHLGVEGGGVRVFVGLSFEDGGVFGSEGVVVFFVAVHIFKVYYSVSQLDRLNKAILTGGIALGKEGRWGEWEGI